MRQFFSPKKRVNDKQRYLLKWDNEVGKWGLYTSTNASVQPPPTKKRELNRFFDALDADIDLTVKVKVENVIAVLLESPHKDEYSDKMSPRGPARGATGTNFQTYFVSHVLPMLVAAGLRLEETLVYRIYMVNPVPYQASLGRLLDKPPKHLNDLKSKVWENLWNADCQEGFVDRMKVYKPRIILNGCTADVKQEVTNTVNSHRSSFELEQHFNIAHPSNWQKNLKPFGKPDSTPRTVADRASSRTSLPAR